MTEHREAKERHERWIGEYKVVIAEVSTVYGNRNLALTHQPGFGDGRR